MIAQSIEAERDESARKRRGLGRSSNFRPGARPCRMAPGTTGGNMLDPEEKPALLELTAKIVAAQLSGNSVPRDDLPGLIRIDYVPPCRPEHRRGSYGTVAVIVVDRACGPRRPRRTT